MHTEEYKPDITIEQMQAMHTAQLLRYYRKIQFYHWVFSPYYDPPEEVKNSWREWKALVKAEMNTREHVLRPSERKKQRLERLKRNRNR